MKFTALALALVCSTTGLLSKSAAASPRVYFIIGGVWDKRTPPVLTGIKAMSDQLKLAGIDTEIHVEHNSHWKQICADILNAPESDTLTLIGHSLGGQAVMDVSRCLGSHGRVVDLAITLDPMQKFFHPPVGLVPDNVVINANFSQSQDWLWRGHADNRRADGSYQGVTNTHVDIPAKVSSPHDWVVQYVGESGMMTELIQHYGTHAAIPTLAR